MDKYRLVILIASIIVAVCLLPFDLLCLGAIVIVNSRAEPGDLAFAIEIAAFASIISIIVIFLVVKGIRYGTKKPQPK